MIARGVLLLSVLALPVMMVSVALDACSSSSNGSPADAAIDVPAYEGEGGICATFTNVGEPCYPASQTVCFRECVTDGCECRLGGSLDGGGTWQCQTDLSCTPDGAPFEDSSVEFTDASSVEGDGGANEDAAIGDAGVDSAIDAH
jgi:hypothetical protein